MDAGLLQTLVRTGKRLLTQMFEVLCDVSYVLVSAL